MPPHEVHKGNTNIAKPTSTDSFKQGFEFRSPAELGQDCGQRMQGVLGMREMRNRFNGVDQGQGRVCRRRRPERMSDNETVEKAII